MNTPLPRTTATARLQALFAAAFLTLATLTAIDQLAYPAPGAAPMAQAGTSAQA